MKPEPRCEMGTSRGRTCMRWPHWLVVGGRWDGHFCKQHAEHCRARYGGTLQKLAVNK